MNKILSILAVATAIIIALFVSVPDTKADFFGGGGQGAVTANNAADKPATLVLTNFPTLRPATRTNINLVFPAPNGKVGVGFYVSGFSTNTAAVSNITAFINLGYATNSTAFTTTDPVSGTWSMNGTNTQTALLWFDSTNFNGANWFTLSFTNKSVTNSWYFTNVVRVIKQQ